MTDRDLFIAALDHADPAERAAWLDHACAGDADCRRRVDVLLKAHDDASRFLAEPAAEKFRPAPDDPTCTAHLSNGTAPTPVMDVRSLLSPADKPGLLGKLDHYEVLEIVGQGGMGVVLKAFDPKLHRLVALKLMAPHLAAHGSARKRFEREARAVAAVRNEHVVAIHAVEAVAATPYLVMEFVGGVSLQERLERRGPLEVKETLRIGMQAARGLAAAHAVGIIHRDIKPANILLENGVERVKLTDFGLARMADDANLTQSGVITGTPNYMSPEQAAGTIPIDARSDLFSLGSVLYALCTGHPPFRAETPLAVLRRVADDAVRPPREVNPDIPDWLDSIIRKLLAKSPADRFQSATEVADLLGQHLAHLQQPSAVPMPEPVTPPGAVRPPPPNEPGEPVADAGQPAVISPAQAPTSPAGFAWLVVIGLVAAPALLFWTQESFWEGYFRPGYFAPVSMIVSSGLLLTVLWWCRRQSEPRWYRLVLTLAMAAVVGGTLIGLLVSWGEGSYLDKLGSASTWHNSGIGVAATLVIGSALVRAIRWMATRPAIDPEPARAAPPAPAAHGPTALALGAGLLVLILGFVVSLFVRELVTPEGGQARMLALLMGIWSAAALMAFGPGVFVARQLWRKRFPAERRADHRAAVLAGLGIGATIMSVVLVVFRTPALRTELFGSPAPAEASLSMNWNRDLIARVTLEREGMVVEEFDGKVKGVGGKYRPGRYTVRGYKDDREIYREEFELPAGGSVGMSLLDAPMKPGYGTLRVDCQDPTVTIEVRGPGHHFQFSRPASGGAVLQGLKPGVKYRLGMARSRDPIHAEDIQLASGETRTLQIPTIVFADRTVSLKPKTGSFPSDVVRMQLSPHRSAVAVERFDGPILVFDADTGAERFTISRPRTHCTAFGFTPDSNHLAYLAPINDGRNQVLRLVEAGEGQPVGEDLTLQLGRAFFNSRALAYSPDGKRLAVSSASNADTESGWKSRILRWEVAGGGAEFRELDPLPWQDGMVKEIRFTPDGSELLTVSGTQLAQGWRWATGDPSRRTDTNQFVTDVVAVGREHAAVAGWSTDLNKAFIADWPPAILREPPPAGPPFSAVALGSLAFSPDDRLLAAGTKGLAGPTWDKLAAVRLRERQTGKEHAILIGHTDWPLDLAFSRGGDGLVTAGKDGTLRFWTLP